MNDVKLISSPRATGVVVSELEDQQVIRLNDAIRNVSGVIPAGNDPRGQRFIVRGFNDIALFQDGFRVGVSRQNTALQELSNIEQIEVLKGPASVLFGAVEPGG